jgi:hypothetical protein
MINGIPTNGILGRPAERNILKKIYISSKLFIKRIQVRIAARMIKIMSA